jgi:hypothetical protein
VLITISQNIPPLEISTVSLLDRVRTAINILVWKLQQGCCRLKAIEIL